MSTREASCHCGQLRLEVTGDPFVVSICHCLDCQRRTGSAFGMQSAFRPDQVIDGRCSDYSRISDEADRKEHVFHFCPDCGSQVFYTEPTEPELIVIAVGSFEDPAFPPPTESGYNSRRHGWFELPDGIAGDLAYNVACCESLAGRPADAIEHLRLAIAGSEQFRAMAAGDSDFDPLRDEAAFRELVD